MKLSNLNIKKIKFSEVDKSYPAEDILMKLGELYQYESGIYGYGNIWTKFERNVRNIIIDELDKAGCIECIFPALQPKSIWDKSNRWDVYTKESDLMFTVDSNLGEYGLAPTAEEAATIFGANRLPSHKNLPAVYYQITEKYRKEMRARGYLFRPRTFVMMDAYSFDKNKEEFEKTYEKINDAYLRIFKRLKLDAKPVVSDGGDIGGELSTEYQVITKLGEDTIVYDKEKDIFINEEVFDDVKDKLNLSDASEKFNSVEVGNNFNLGTKYSEAMKLYYIDKDGSKKPYYMGCYGLGLGRIMAAIMENNALYDEEGALKGFSIPKEVAPYKLQIVCKSTLLDKANKIYEDMQKSGINVILDDRDYSIGLKIKDAYSLGTPYILIMGNNFDENALEVEETITGEKKTLTLSALKELLK